MAKTLAERIAWHRAPEARSWKRKLQFVEIVIIATMVVSSCVALIIVDGRKPLASVFALFAACMLISLAIIGPFLLRDVSVSRYVRSFIILGLLSGAGCLAGFGLLILGAARTAA